MIVLDSTGFVVEQAAHLRIDDESVARWARDVSPAALRPLGHDLFAHLAGDEAQLANIVLLIDALNFCFWSSDPIQFEWQGQTYERFNAFFVSVILAARYEPRWYDPQFWLEAPADELRAIFGGRGELLLMDDRQRIIRETARILLERFDGQFINAIESVCGRAWPLAVLLMTEFDSFRDVANYRDKTVYFMKRAQICALDQSVARQRQHHPPLSGLSELTAFADYRVPQALRHLGILKLSPDLTRRVEAEEELDQGSAEEVEIRAASIQAVDRMVKAVGRRGRVVTAWEVDWYLWRLSHDAEVAVNHHRTRTVYY
jgi:hypothetical protein